VNIAVVVPVSRGDRVPAILAGFRSQKHESKRLVLVLNGPARAADVPELTRDATVLRVEGGTPARARNAGLDWLRGERAETVAFWDDDDAYLPGYLTEVSECLGANPGAVCGKFVRYVRFDDGLYYTLGRQDGFLGGTISAWVEGLPPIPDLPLNEDREWCFAMRDAGRQLVATSGKNYIYNRRSGSHAWHSNKAQLLRVYGPAVSLGRADDAIAADYPRPPVNLIPRPTLEEMGEAMLEDLCRRVDGPN
jgi:glycosyltransferase involved in cell wall biosynthesis